jgi:N-acetylglucosaminyldiphosphoundecaprenol N-acetyl-beta-D-mannosaminyltransferase
VTPNAGHLTNIFDNPELSEIYSTAELSLIDGWPIVVAAKNASKLKITRVTGSDLLPELFTHLTKDIRVGIIGGNNELLIRQSLESRFPELNIQVIDTSQWTNSVYDIRRLRELVQYNALSIVLLCLGHPKQELLAKELKNYDWAGSRPDWIMCVGATIDFLTGEQKRSPKFFQKIGLEWFFRLVTNPKKFSQRYLNAVIPSLKLIIKSFGMRKFN